LRVRLLTPFCATYSIARASKRSRAWPTGSPHDRLVVPSGTGTTWFILGEGSETTAHRRTRAHHRAPGNRVRLAPCRRQLAPLVAYRVLRAGATRRQRRS